MEMQKSKPKFYETKIYVLFMTSSGSFETFKYSAFSMFVIKKTVTQ